MAKTQVFPFILIRAVCFGCGSASFVISWFSFKLTVIICLASWLATIIFLMGQCGKTITSRTSSITTWQLGLFANLTWSVLEQDTEPQIAPAVSVLMGECGKYCEALWAVSGRLEKRYKIERPFTNSWRLKHFHITQFLLNSSSKTFLPHTPAPTSNASKQNTKKILAEKDTSEKTEWWKAQRRSIIIYH